MACQWWIGDWLNAGEQRWGEMYAQAVDATEAANDTLRQYKFVAKEIELCRRRHNLSWGVHREIAYLPETDQDEALARAESEAWTVREARAWSPRAGQPGGHELVF